MKENILIDKSIDFGARIVKLHRYLSKEKHETVLSKQILRSGTSIGANSVRSRIPFVLFIFVLRNTALLLNSVALSVWGLKTECGCGMIQSR